MSRKLRSASALALVAMTGFTLFNAETSAAFAQDLAEGLATPTALVETAETSETASAAPAAKDPAPATDAEVVFVSEPVVQELPAQPEPPAFDASGAGSLRELVASMPDEGALDTQMQCLAGAIYFESRGEPLEGQLAVGRVIMNRAASGRFPDSICGVVYQKSQFSFVRGGRMPKINTGSAAWTRAKAVARIAHDDLWDCEAEGSLFFHASYVNPGWKLKRVGKISTHIFYR